MGFRKNSSVSMDLHTYMVPYEKLCSERLAYLLTYILKCSACNVKAIRFYFMVVNDGV
jgi:hypothetical protein